MRIPSGATETEKCDFGLTGAEMEFKILHKDETTKGTSIGRREKSMDNSPQDLAKKNENQQPTRWEKNERRGGSARSNAGDR